YRKMLAIRLRPGAIMRRKMIVELSKMSPSKRVHSPILKTLRAELAKENKNICFGQLCQGQIQSLEIFCKGKSRQNKCKKCQNQKPRKRPAKTPVSTDPNLKWCLMCLQFLQKSQFTSDKTRKDGLDPRCKTCKIQKTTADKDKYKSQPIEEKIKKYPKVKC